MPEHLIEGLRRFKRETFPRYRDHYRRLVEEGQSPSVLFIGCSDSRVIPDLLTDTGPGDLFVVRNAGAFVPPDSDGQDRDGVAAAIEYAVLVLGVTDIVVCGHSHCGAVGALYRPPEGTPHIRRWLELGAGARIDGVTDPDEDVLRRTEQRAIALQLEHLMTYSIVQERVARGDLSLHGWHYIIEEGDVRVLDVEHGAFE